eukprot:TRINITY_DN29506_c0_g1_i1.p1 TRINITY_DN29506_c0_g1~~TRINITY_DN29506_c0_g1_i1.p1  ORF type:complete len:177 (-),score=21.36 TRINITY_DN29506_c0_g1_i1:430-960(-)
MSWKRLTRATAIARNGKAIGLSPFSMHGTRCLTHNNDSAASESEMRPTTTGKTLSHILGELNRRVPDNLVKVRVEDDFATKYVPWHVLNRIMNLHVQEWSGEVRNITYSTDGKSVSVVYRVTIHGTDTEVYRESTGTASVEDKGYGDPVQKAEAMAFRRACARLGLGLHLYHEELL